MFEVPDFQPSEQEWEEGERNRINLNWEHFSYDSVQAGSGPIYKTPKGALTAE